MLIKLLSVSPKDDYRKVLKRRSTISIIFAAVGIVTMVAPFLLMSLMPDLDDYTMGYYSGSGGAILAIGIFSYFSTRRTLRDEKRMRSEQIKETDERAQEISRRAAVNTIIITMLALYLSLLVAILVNPTVYFTLLAVLAIFIAIYLVCFCVYRKML